jgi:hypothetical protein
VSPALNPNPPKKCVVLAWARTITQPRLSEVLAQRVAAAATAEASAEKEKTKKRGRCGKRKNENENKDNKEAEETKKKKQQRPLVGTTNDVYSNVLSLRVRIVRCDCRLSVFQHPMTQRLRSHMNHVQRPRHRATDVDIPSLHYPRTQLWLVEVLPAADQRCSRPLQ